MRLSEVDLAYIKDYCGVTDNDSDEILENALMGAKDYILNATGLSAGEAEQYEDLVIALQTLAHETFYNREYQTASGYYNSKNPLVEQIIEQHRRNFL